MIMRDIDLAFVDPERILRELTQMLLYSNRPSTGLRYLEQCGVIERRHPALYSLKSCIQSLAHHPEGDVWEHTLLVVDRAAELRVKSRDPQTLMWAALLHDIGKPGVTRQEGEKVTAYGHDTQGEELARRFLLDLRASRRLFDSLGCGA
jgi:tRNA nucleotidyltransferase (CCA-adding enzyme)